MALSGHWVYFFLSSLPSVLTTQIAVKLPGPGEVIRFIDRTDYVPSRPDPYHPITPLLVFSSCGKEMAPFFSFPVDFC